MEWSYNINGNDLFETFAVGIENGVEDFLKFPSRKASVQTDWQEEQGLDIDLSNPVFASRDIVLKCWCAGNGNVDFWKKYNGFFVQISQPGTFVLFNTTIQIGFNVFYKQAGTVSFITNQGGNKEVAAKFEITVTEPKPMTGFRVQPTTGYLVDSNGNPILTNSGKYIII